MDKKQRMNPAARFARSAEMAEESKARAAARVDDAPPQDHVIVMSDGWPGYWGLGKTITEAVKNAQWLETGDKVIVVACEADAYVDDYGTLYRHVKTPAERGVLREVTKSYRPVEFIVADRKPCEPVR